MGRYVPRAGVSHTALVAHGGNMRSALSGRMSWGEFDRKERRKAERAAKKQAAKQARARARARMIGEGN